MTDEHDNVITVDFSSDGRTLLQKDDREPLKRRCAHGAIRIDEPNREVSCKLCDALLDPFDVILGEARRQTRHWETTNHYAREADRLAEQIEDLKRQVKNAKAQARRWKEKTNR